MKFLLGISFAVVTWFLTVMIPFIPLSLIFGQTAPVTQTVASLMVLIVGPVLGIWAWISCLNMSFSDGGIRRQTTVFDFFLTLIRLPFFCLTIFLWVILAVPLMALSVAGRFFLILVIYLFSYLCLPLVILMAVLHGRKSYEDLNRSRKEIVGILSAENVRVGKSMWESPLKLAGWLTR